MYCGVPEKAQHVGNVVTKPDNLNWNVLPI